MYTAPPYRCVADRAGATETSQWKHAFDRNRSRVGADYIWIRISIPSTVAHPWFCTATEEVTIDHCDVAARKAEPTTLRTATNVVTVAYRMLGAAR